MINGTEDRSLIQVNAIFNTDSKSPNSGNKATLLYGHFPERSAVKQMEIPLAVGQDMNSQCSHVAKGASRTLDMHMVTPVGARTFITSAQGCNCSEPPCSCGRQGSAFLLWDQGELKDCS